MNYQSNKIKLRHNSFECFLSITHRNSTYMMKADKVLNAAMLMKKIASFNTA